MSSLNKAMIIGNLGADPDLRYTQSNKPVATLSVATSEKWKDNNGELQEKTEWHRVTLWNRLAEISEKYLKKGSKVYIEGKIQTRQWEDKEGVKRYTTEIVGLTMTMLDTKGSDTNRPPAPPIPEEPGTLPKDDAGGYDDPHPDDGDDSLPF